MAGTTDRLDGTTSVELAAEIGGSYWWHSIDLGDGVVTPGRKSLAEMAVEFARTFDKLDLDGSSLLDIGAWNGGFSVEAKRRGAARVAALDHVTWNVPAWRGRESFDLVNSRLDLGMEAIDLDLDSPGLSLGSLGEFDFVLLLGVFYHLKDPLAALREAAAIATKALVVQTYLEETADPRPAMMFYPGSELGDDPTNWWGPNAACMISLLKDAGFARVEITPYGNRGVFHAFRG